MKPNNGLTGKEICKLIKDNDLMDIPIYNPDDNEAYYTLQFSIKEATDEDPSYHIIDCNLITGEVSHFIGRIER